MDETPEELDEIRREAAQIDPYRYRRRKRIWAAIALGAFGAGLAWVVIEATSQGRNPCERVRDHLCKTDAASAACKTYDSIFKESVQDSSPKMRSDIRGQCETKITRLKSEDGVTVR